MNSWCFLVAEVFLTQPMLFQEKNNPIVNDQIFSLITLLLLGLIQLIKWLSA
jgi:hypothetical protein